MKQTINERIENLREWMRANGFSAFVFPSSDPHNSEYVADHWKSREWISGFTGSAGTAVVTLDRAALWTDSRYFIAAAEQLAGTEYRLMKLRVAGTPTVCEWLADELAAYEKPVVGLDGNVNSFAEVAALTQELATRGNIRVWTDADPMATLWTDRPAIPGHKVCLHPLKYAGETTASKISRIRKSLAVRGADGLLVTALDEIAWVLNLRGSDVPYNPVFLSYLLIGTDSATLFVDEAKLNPASRALLAEAGITTAPYAAVREALSKISDGLLVNPDKTAVSTLQLMPSENRLIENINPSTLFKSVKSAADLDHVREAMRQDGAALCGFFAEFERNLADGTAMNELDIDTMLHKYRSARPNFVSLSFNTIAGYNANGALPHYAATPEAFSDITGSGLLLIDSGAQYLGGTTDITRVVPVGETTPEQKRDYTLVLKAHIALAETVFPENIAAPLLDAICRNPLWQEQCNYGHGTGHGVGYFMNVHEGPQVISYLAPVNPHHAMKAGMITSNEPGLYRPGRWGVRIENLVANQPVASPQETEFGKFLHFETLTLCPIDTRPIDLSLMTAEEIRWLNAYHADVREKLLPLVDGAARDWLLLRTEAV